MGKSDRVAVFGCWHVLLINFFTALPKQSSCPGSVLLSAQTAQTWDACHAFAWSEDTSNSSVTDLELPAGVRRQAPLCTGTSQACVLLSGPNDLGASSVDAMAVGQPGPLQARAEPAAG